MLIQESDNIIHYDIVKKRRLHTVKLKDIKRVCWNQDKSMLALASKHNIYICDKTLKQLTQHKSRFPVKSMAWHKESGCLIYSTTCQARIVVRWADS